MPIPMLIGLAAATIGGIGIKKGYDATQDNRAAQDYYYRAEDILEEAERQLDNAREETNDTLNRLGKLKLEIWEHQFSRYVELMEQIHRVEIVATTNNIQSIDRKTYKYELAGIQEQSMMAAEVLDVGVKSLGAGALTGIAAYGGTVMFGTASTGTAIASLSGAAATNATLAWFGGGSLAAGGLGMAGGTAVLGGVVAAPVLAVAGMIMASKAKENLNDAMENFSQAKLAAEEMANATSRVRTIQKVAKEFNSILRKTDRRMAETLNRLESVLQEVNAIYENRNWFQKLIGFIKNDRGPNYQKFSESQRHVVHQAYIWAQITKKLSETPILKGDGALSDDYSAVLIEGRKMLGDA